MKQLKQATKVNPVDQIKVGDKVQAGFWVPLQNIGTTMEYRKATVLKINRVTMNVEMENGSVYQIEKQNIKSL